MVIGGLKFVDEVPLKGKEIFRNVDEEGDTVHAAGSPSWKMA